MPDDVIFRLSPGGGPPPEAELLFHAQRAREYGHIWVGLRPQGNAECVRHAIVNTRSTHRDQSFHASWSPGPRG